MKKTMLALSFCSFLMTTNYTHSAEPATSDVSPQQYFLTPPSEAQPIPQTMNSSMTQGLNETTPSSINQAGYSRGMTNAPVYSPINSYSQTQATSNQDLGQQLWVPPEQTYSKNYFESWMKTAKQPNATNNMNTDGSYDVACNDCYCLCCHYRPCYYYTTECQYVPRCDYQKCCRYVPQYYQVTRCQNVPEYYTVTKCRQVPEYYCQMKCRCVQQWDSCNCCYETRPMYYQELCCKQVPQYYEEQCCRQVPQYYEETCCRYCPEYYYVCNTSYCPQYKYNRQCTYVPQYYYKHVCGCDNNGSMLASCN